jgi:hypothetical protein
MSSRIVTMIGTTVREWIGGACCVGFPGWVMLVRMLLIKYVKKPSDMHDPERQHGFPVAPKESEDSNEKPPE